MLRADQEKIKIILFNAPSMVLYGSMLDPMALNLLLNQEILPFGIFIDKCYGHNEAFVVQKMRPCFQRPWVQSLLTVGLLLNGHIWFLGIVP